MEQYTFERIQCEKNNWSNVSVISGSETLPVTCSYFDFDDYQNAMENLPEFEENNSYPGGDTGLVLKVWHNKSFFEVFDVAYYESLEYVEKDWEKDALKKGIASVYNVLKFELDENGKITDEDRFVESYYFIDCPFKAVENMINGFTN